MKVDIKTYTSILWWFWGQNRRDNLIEGPTLAGEETAREKGSAGPHNLLPVV